MAKSVLVLPGANHSSIVSMFTAQNYVSVSDIEDADLVCFTGGEDVDPSLYNEHAHPTTRFNEERDDREAAWYYHCLNMGIPMVGICRGGQFLNVMNGGKLYQDVDGHALHGTHEAWVYDSTTPIQVTSTHHQMMRVNFLTDHKMLMISRISKKKASMSDRLSSPIECITYCKPEFGRDEDVESVFYPGTRSLCFQPHPENMNGFASREAFFKFIREFIWGLE